MGLEASSSAIVMSAVNAIVKVCSSAPPRLANFKLLWQVPGVAGLRGSSLRFPPTRKKPEVPRYSGKSGAVSLGWIVDISQCLLHLLSVLSMSSR